MVSQHLVLFAKPPRPGEVKTRLAAGIGPVAAAGVAEALLLDTIAVCEALAGLEPERPAALVLAYADDSAYFAAIVTTQWELIHQEGADLGERLENALAASKPSDDDATVFVGMDAPHLPQGYLLRGFDALLESDAVLGPCDDGGYYLMGVRGSWPRGVLSGVRWSTADAFSDTRGAFERASLTWATLPSWYDIDDLVSLRRLADDLRSMPMDALPHTRAALETLQSQGLI